MSEAREQWDYLLSGLPTSFRRPRVFTALGNLADGEIALAEGNVDEAISLLQEGLYGLRSSGNAAYFRCSESLANAWERQGDLEMALRTLEDASQQKSRTYPWANPGGASPKLHWMRVRLRLAQLYRRLEREAEALEIETELRDLLRYADSDLWLVRQLGEVHEAAPR